LIQEGHVPHRLCLILRVHQNSVPALQNDSLVIRVADSTANVHTRISSHCSPAPAFRFRVVGKNPSVCDLGHAVGMPIADEDPLTACAVAEVGPVRLAAVASAERFIAKHELLVHDEIELRQKEPFALSDVRSVLASAASFAVDSHAPLGDLDFGGLQGFLGLPNRANGSGLWNGGDKPVSLVVAAEELLLGACFAESA
jgi:hypothetical protein